ncbi:DUF3285 domain-containing protein [Phormidium tenue]|jgi:hypothetical protein|uniref:DUF3285 domain-containing protein n=1 Tax=Phormidium tenue FACHB-1050 TaxID=2692857 RepID=A0ABR8C3Y8_9CYAN|nr:DUF3285 domain-containing protein [Phormidium tenue]MBD2315354.1 DUF3285 domain-containing protein [Phormidium tenue FACHB-1050]
MNSDSNTSSNSSSSTTNSSEVLNQVSTANNQKEQDSFVKLAMKNMVKKGSTSLFHFSLTVFGVIGALLGLAIIFH